MIRTKNPVLKPDVFAKPQTWDSFMGSKEGAAVVGAGRVVAAAKPNTMTLQGAVNASFILLSLTVGTAFAAWFVMEQNRALVMPLTFGGMIAGFVLALVISFKPRIAPVAAPVYAILEGAFVAGISMVYASLAASKGFGGVTGTGIIVYAVLLTFGIFGSLLLAYTSRLIKPSENFKLGVAAATGGVFFLLLGSFVLGMLGVQIPYIWEAGPIGIGISAVIVVIASLNLVLDFDFIEEGAKNELPKHMEWYAGFGLLVTIIWLYISILRLLYLIAASRE